MTADEVVARIQRRLDRARKKWLRHVAQAQPFSAGKMGGEICALAKLQDELKKAIRDETRNRASQ